MNKRINELAKQASHQSPDGYPVTIPYSKDFAEKFAELIVKECMLICGAIQGAGELRNMHEFASGAAQCKVIIKRDFGVEE